MQNAANTVFFLFGYPHTLSWITPYIRIPDKFVRFHFKSNIIYLTFLSSIISADFRISSLTFQPLWITTYRVWNYVRIAKFTLVIEPPLFYSSFIVLLPSFYYDFP